METPIVDGFEDEIAASPGRDAGSTAALVAMIACAAILLLMLSACGGSVTVEPRMIGSGHMIALRFDSVMQAMVELTNVAQQ